MLRRMTNLWLLALLALLAGCAANPLRQYDSELKETVDLVKQGSLKQAVALLEKNNEPGLISKDKDILYYFEKGELLTLDNDHVAAMNAWLKADETVREWEDSFKTDPTKLFGDIGSYLINDKTRRYDGQDYEKVMLSAKLTLSHLMQGNYQDARVEMKKTYEREDLIKNFREKEYDQLQEEAKTQNVTASLKDMKDYPMAELDTPEVLQMKNGFQNAFAHYLAAYYFDVTGEPSLAEPGYRRVLELKPDSQAAKAGLRDVGRRKAGAKESDVLFVVESGFSPSWQSVMVPIPLPTGSGKLVITPLSFPRIKSENPGFVPTTIKVGGKDLRVETMSNFDVMARRLLKDQMPGILLRTTIRAVLKSVAQDQMQKTSSAALAMGPLGLALSAATTVATVATEQADDRSWRTLPERISIARAVLPHGKHTLEFQTGKGSSFKKEIEIGNRFTILPVRLTGANVYVGQPNASGNLTVDVAEPVSAIPPSTPVDKKPAKKSTVKKPVKPAKAAGAVEEKTAE